MLVTSNLVILATSKLVILVTSKLIILVTSKLVILVTSKLTLVAALADAWCHRVRAKTSWPDVSILCDWVRM